MTFAVEYRDLPGFPGYKAGSDGTIWSRRKSWSTEPGEIHQITGWVARSGYVTVVLRNSNRSYYRLVHRLVLEAFTGPCPEGMEGCHGDGDKTNNRLSNLRWDNHGSNERDKAKHGTLVAGEKSHFSVLTDAEVISIRAMRDKGLLQKDIAKRFGVSQSSVSRILGRKNWAHIQ